MILYRYSKRLFARWQPGLISCRFLLAAGATGSEAAAVA
jgi:hypothetical protein